MVVGGRFLGTPMKSANRTKGAAASKQAKDELSPKAIADLTGMKAVNVRVLLGKMVASGDTSQPRVGFYAATFPNPQE
jgi:hypothetical protein